MKEKNTQVSIAADVGGPGPWKYTLRTTVGFINHDTTKYRFPAYSFGPNSVGDTVKTPPSTVYIPEKNHLQTVATKDLMTPRTKYRKKDPTPCLNKYSMPPVLGNQQPNNNAVPSSTFTGHQHVGSYVQELTKTPRPGRFDAMHPDKNGNKAQRDTKRCGSYTPGGATKKPGPGQNRPKKVTNNRRSAPRCTFGIKHSDSACVFFG